MKRWRSASQFAMMLSLTWIVGCSRQVALPGAGSTADSAHLPFERVSDGGGISPTAAFASEVVPPGTEINIRLRSALSSADSRAGDSFEAVLDEPVAVAGQTVLPRNASVTGRVVATKASAGQHDPGYIRLTLASIAVSGKSIPLHTSSLFAKGQSREKTSPIPLRSKADGNGSVVGAFLDSRTGNVTSRDTSDVKFSTGRRFTFRLAQPLHLEN